MSGTRRFAPRGAGKGEARVPEGHTLHRLAAHHQEWFGGRPVRVSSPQGRFADGAARIDGRVLTTGEAHGKHLFLGFDSGEWPAAAPAEEQAEPRPTTAATVSASGSGSQPPRARSSGRAPLRSTPSR